MNVLTVENITKVYGSRYGAKTEALRGVNLAVEQGEFIAIMGESGSGKTTLLNILATLDQPTEGCVVINGQKTQSLSENMIAAFRRKELGFVFQQFNLLDHMNVQDNILLPLVLMGERPEQLFERLQNVSTLLGSTNLLTKYPFELSGGQKQRVAIARAIITSPSLLLADEPTGSLDSGNSTTIMNLFTKIHEQGQTILMVTHSVPCAVKANRILFIKDGRLFYELYRGEMSELAWAQKINEAMSALHQKKEALHV